MLLRRELHRRGLRYRLCVGIIGKPDLVFPRSRVAVFIDGDWWHGNAWRLRGYSDFDSQFAHIANGDFWREKIVKNVERDAHVTAALRADDWCVLRLWESEVRSDLAAAAERVEAAVRRTVPRQKRAAR
jgi:DNA mismatch endonuclease (patch repair protein)